MRRDHTGGQLQRLFQALHLLDLHEYLFQFLRLAFDVSSKDGQQVFVFFVYFLKGFFECITNYVYFTV